MNLPARGPRVRELGLPLPPGRMPHRVGLRPLKRWRYAGVFGPELQLCVGDARIGPVPVRWWAVAERGRPLREGRGGITLAPGAVRVDDGDVAIRLELQEGEPVETVTGYGRAFAWTAKRADAPARGTVRLGERVVEVDARGVVDESAGYHPRHTRWRWSAGVGSTVDGRSVGWNLVAGIHDSARDSERTIWLDGEPHEPGPVAFDDALTAIRFATGESMRFDEWCVREDRTNLLVVRSRYRQPFGTFHGELPGGIELAAGYGVMEEHDVRW